MGKMTKFENIVRNMTSVLDIPLTVKMRTGITSDKNTAHSLIPRLRDAGVSLITVRCLLFFVCFLFVWLFFLI
jgi:tRNA-dihydrouridine synthase 3